MRLKNSSNIIVTVKNTTCTIQNKTVNIFSRDKKKVKLDLTVIIQPMVRLGFLQI